MRGSSNSLFLPSTFEERGAAAPFTTPSLALSRVRPDERHGLVLLMPNLGGADGAYVVPWASIGDVITMSVHDRALHEEVLAHHAVTPATMRRAALKIARTGLAGPKAAHAAELLLEAEEAQRAETHLILILSLLGALGLSSRQLLTLKPASREWDDLVRAMLLEAGSHLLLDGETIYRRIGELSRILAPVGLAVARRDGRLRRLTVELAAFRNSVGDWSRHDPSESAPHAAFASEVADLTARIAAGVLGRLDKTVEDITRVVRQWDKQALLAERAAARLSWLLDGWDYVLAMWSAAMAAGRPEQRESLPQIMRVLPLVPRDEAEEAEAERERRHDLLQHKRPRVTADRHAGQYDIEQVSRYEALKAEATERAIMIEKTLG